MKKILVFLCIFYSTILPQSSSVAQEVSREKREQAYAKLLEGQRYFWQMTRQRTRLSFANYAKLAKQSFQKAIELDPSLAEAYTAIAEIALYSQPMNLDEAVSMASLATKVNPDNFGAHRILAGVYSIKSGLGTGKYNQEFAQKAIAEWQEVTRLDPRNAEAWAFLSEFYEKEGKREEKINALRKWLSSVSPIEARFYRMVFGNWADLSPENAALRLGKELIKSKRAEEAIEILSPIVADQPENSELVETLREAVFLANKEFATKAIYALEQAAMINPSNYELVEILVETQLFSDKSGEAISFLRTIINKVTQKERDKKNLMPYYVKLGEAYLEAEKIKEAIEAFEEALKAGGIYDSPASSENDLYFAERIFSMMISAYKAVNRYAEAKVVIERARLVLGSSSSFADRQSILILVETGKKQEAYDAVRAIRSKFPKDESLVFLEAQILARNARVAEGANLIKSLMKNKGKPFSVEDFRYLIMLAEFYGQADQGAEAISIASELQSLAQTNEQKVIAKLVLSNAYYHAESFDIAEKLLNEVLKQLPDNPLALNNLGYFLVEQNRQLEKALEMIQKAVRSDPTNPSYLDSLAWAYFKLGNYEEAEKYIRKATRRGTDSAEVYEHLGDISQKLGKMESAKNAWQKALNLTISQKAAVRLREKIRKAVK
ncbi:MAG: tetratricopeptide repeat protein [Pyrinomonadaceae bacterium]|nr:tetratricopeptide repeat protein [Pyrinomonadaceae bacterium]MCX7640915.1 tetratricopeptide repeat protein [Pyrinomonadaceae bacterium]MDW8304697.1 tetratricopeptide repeat protein [Acidobacteriota bacterium]